MAHQGYMGEDSGPFRCDHCQYYPEERRCNNKVVIGWAKQKLYGLKMDGNLAVVDPGGCSDEFKPSGESEMPISDYFGGGGKKVMANMKKTYKNPKKAKQVFYATANKNKLNTAPSKK